MEHNRTRVCLSVEMLALLPLCLTSHWRYTSIISLPSSMSIAAQLRQVKSGKGLRSVDDAVKMRSVHQWFASASKRAAMRVLS